MHKDVKAIIVALMCMISFLFIVNNNVYASDAFSGHIYKVNETTKYDDGSTGTKINEYWVFGNNNQLLITRDKNTVRFIKNHKELIDSVIESQNNYREKESYTYELNGNNLKVTSSEGLTLADTSVNGSKINKCTVPNETYKENLSFKGVG